MTSTALAPNRPWPPGGVPSPTLAKCLLLAALLHVLLALVVGSAPPGSARLGEGVFGALNVTLRGPVGEGAGPGPAAEAYSGPVGRSPDLRWGGAVRDAPVAPPVTGRPGAARLGTWSASEIGPEAGADAGADRPPSVVEPTPMPIERVELAPAVDVPAAPPTATAAEPALPLVPTTPPVAVEPPTAPVASMPREATPPIAAPRPRVGPGVAAPALELPSAAVPTIAMPDLPAPAAPVLVVPPSASPAPVAVDPAVAAPSAAASPVAPAPAAGTSLAAPPSDTGRPSAGSPDAGARLGHDVATPPSAPSSAPRLNLELPRARGGEISGQGSRGLLPLMPRPAETKSKLERDIEKAGQPDCRQAYAGMGLLAAVPLVADALKDKGCRW